jgi:hypothetical protein
MPDTGKMNYPGEEGHYNQNPPITNYPDPQFAPTQNFGPGPLGGKLPNRPPERRNGWKVATLILSITTIVFLATTVLAFTRSSASTARTVITAPTTTLTQPAQQTPTALATAAPTSALTPSSSTPAVQTSLTPVPDGVIQENITLTCNGCNDPIRVTINTVRVDSANGRMIWDNTLKDVTGSDFNYGISTYTLQDSTAQTPAIPAVFAQSSGSLVSNIPSNTQGVFAFVPSRNVTYILTVAIGVIGITVTFNPVKITF